jgi:exopolysaccharide biosynthesis polyprenyl glycosylphosphotransferase
MLIFISTISLVFSLSLTPLMRSISLRYQIGDYPGLRKIHTKFIPRMGGVGIILGVALGVTFAWIIYPASFHNVSFNLGGVAVGLLMIAGLGAYDDIKGIGSFGKLVVQFLAASIVISSGLQIEYLSLPFLNPIHLGILSLPLTLLWLVGVTNAFNLLDGLDGLAVGVAAVASATFFCIGVFKGDDILIFTTTALFFSCVGFLRYNFHPASIFMGDTGSLFLGFLLACLSLRVIQFDDTSQVSLLVAVVALAVPIVDTSVAFFRRLKKGLHPLKADKEHIHHRLMDLGLTHRQTVVIHYAIALLSGFIAFVLIQVDSLYAASLLAIVFVAALFSIRRLGYLEEMTAQSKEAAPPIQPLSIARIIDRIVLVSGDVIAIILSFLCSYWFRFHSGFFAFNGFIPLDLYFRSPAMLLLGVLWLAIFAFAGLYEIPWDASRIDYIFLILRMAAIGTLILFFVTLDLENVTIEGRVTTIVYGATIAFCVVLIRMLIVSLERKYEILGFRRRNTLIVGTSKAAEKLMEEIQHRPGLKYNVVGFIDREISHEAFMNVPVVGTYDEIPGAVKKHNVEEVLIATDYDSREEILDIVARCNGMVPNVKVLPESIDVLGGFKTQEIIGHPLIRLYPTNMRRWQWIVKRLIDIIVSLFILIPFLPLWILIDILIKIDSPGPAFFTQYRVGKKGKIFKLYKYRSMIHDAEKETGPVWATHDDKRITRLGRVLRNLRLDEVPQFINVLKGEMSLVGPRPERPFFVEQLKQEISFYSRRLFVRPGITGWAQVKHRYDRSLEDVKEKIRYDLYYLENMSLTLDLKILLRTILVALSGKGTH